MLMTRNIWTRALWGGVIGITAADLLLAIARAAGGMQVNLLAGLADLVAAQWVAYSPSGMILGFVIHLLAGALFALLFAAIIRSFNSRHNLIAGAITGLLLWLIWGLALPPLGITPAPWAAGTATTIISLLSTLIYGLILGYAVSEEAVRERA